MKKRKKVNAAKLATNVALLALGLYLGVSVVLTQVELLVKKQELKTINDQIEKNMSELDELRRINLSGDQEMYIIRTMREKFGYSAAGDVIFIDMSSQ